MRRLLITSLTAVALLAVPASAGGPPVVRVDDNFFKPERLVIQKGGKVVWKWKGENPHNLKISKGRKLKQRAPVKVSGKFSYRFRSTGRWRVICEIHASSMRMRVRVKAGQARRR